jgi:hypothetical protein
VKVSVWLALVVMRCGDHLLGRELLAAAEAFDLGDAVSAYASVFTSARARSTRLVCAST